MKSSLTYRLSSLTLIIALAFGQLGAGFFHNKHDAHQSIVDLDHTVLVAHGEHCKICSVDWVHQFVATDNNIQTSSLQPQSFEEVKLISSFSFSQSRASDRAPPVTA